MSQTSPHHLSRRQAIGAAALAGGLAAGRRFAPRAARAQQMPPSFPKTAGSLTRLTEDVWVWTFSGFNSLFIGSDDGSLVTEPSSQPKRQASSARRDSTRTRIVAVSCAIASICASASTS